MKLKLVENWRESWKWASVQLAAIVAIAAGVLSSNPGLLLGLIGYLPEGSARTIASVAVSSVVFGLPVLTRILERCSGGDDAAGK